MNKSLPCHLLQELKGKILLKAKKIGGLENSLDGALTGEVSDEEETANSDAETLEDPPAGSANNVKVGEAFGNIVVFMSEAKWFRCAPTYRGDSLHFTGLTC